MLIRGYPFVSRYGPYQFLFFWYGDSIFLVRSRRKKNKNSGGWVVLAVETPNTNTLVFERDSNK